jgi:hypothetical protein
MKNAAGIYGLLVLCGIIIGPFIKIGTQYLMLKCTAAVCSGISGKNNCSLIIDFSSAMGYLLAMTGISCLLFMIAIVCYMKGASF